MEHEAIIKQTVRKYFKITEDREDATQEVIYLLLKKGSMYNEVGNIQGYIRTVSKHYCLNVLNKKRLNYQSYGNLIPEGFLDYSCGSIAESSAVIDHLLRKVDKLPSKQQRVLNMLIHGYSYTEISEGLGITYNAVKCLIRDSRKRLAKSNSLT